MLLYINKILTRTVLLLGPGMVGTVIGQYGRAKMLVMKFKIAVVGLYILIL